MHKTPLHDLVAAARVFHARGFPRSATAIASMARRLDVSRRYKGGLSAGAAAKLLGIDPTTIARHCIAGTLKADRRGTRRSPQQGGDSWEIKRHDLRQFVIDNLANIDIRKVDKFAFVALLIGNIGEGK